MGTSKSYGSPKWPGVTMAVGAAVSQGLPNNRNPQLVSAIGKFASAYKTYITSGTVAPGGGTGRGQGVSVRASRGKSGGGRGGGGGGAARLRAANVGARLGQFISTARESGIGQALKDFDLSDLINKPLDEFLDAVADRLSGDGGLLDDDILNQAMADTLNELAKDVDGVAGLDALLKSGNVNIQEILQSYYANMLAANFEQKEYSIVREKISREETKDFFGRARDVIRAIVRDELSRERDLASINWNNPEGQRIADEINQEVLDILMP